MFDSFLASFGSMGTFGQILEIIVLNTVLSGDNGDIIALACRGVPAEHLTVAIADVVMSLDNVLALATGAKNSIVALILGLATSIPMLVIGASLITSLLTRYLLFICVGTNLFGGGARGVLNSDSWLIDTFGHDLFRRFGYPAAATGALLVIGIGYLSKNRRSAAHWFRNTHHHTAS